MGAEEDSEAKIENVCSSRDGLEQNKKEQRGAKRTVGQLNNVFHVQAEVDGEGKKAKQI